MTTYHLLFIALLCCIVFGWFASAIAQFYIVLLVLLFVPGYLIERLIAAPSPTTTSHLRSPLLFVRPALWMGTSLSSVAILYAWTTWASLSLTTPLIAILLAATCIAALWYVWQELASLPKLRTFVRQNASALWAWSIMILVLLFTLWVRFEQIRACVLPNWVDSVHHTLMARVVVETGMAPYSLRPYVPVDNVPYHWGYHVFTATVARLTSIELPTVLLWEGQVFNALQTISCAALAVMLWHNPRAGIGAAIVVGFISIMPSYYVSWGRYTHLTGLLVLPPIAIAWHNWLHTRSRRWLLWAAILLAGVSIIHMRILVFAVCFVGVITLVWLVQTPHTFAHIWRQTYVSIIGAAIAGTLALPWFWSLFQRMVLSHTQRAYNIVSGGEHVKLHEGLLWAGHNQWLIALALLALCWGIWHRSSAAVMQLGWVSSMWIVANLWSFTYIVPFIGLITLFWALQQRATLVALVSILLLLCNPLLVQLPYFSLITNDVVIISMFVPISTLVGGGMHTLFTHFRGYKPLWQTVARTLGGVGVVVSCLIGAGDLRDVINPDTMFVGAGDVAALHWIAENTPPDARFLINAAGWYPKVARGTDGGYWILPFTGRWASTPPVPFIHGTTEYVEAARKRNDIVANFTPGNEDAIYQLIERDHITHIYLGKYNAPLTIAIFSDTTRFRPVYHYDNITILAVHHDT